MTEFIGSHGNYVRLDWKAYFDQFVEVHGEPILHNDWLLFKDGWRYGLHHSYQGPEKEPPQDIQERNAFIRIYWQHQIEGMTAERDAILRNVEAVKGWSYTRSLPLQSKTVYKDRDDAGKEITKITKATNLNTEHLERKAADLDIAIKEGNQILEGLE